MSQCPHLQYLNEDASSVVLMEDTTASIFVVVGVYYSSDYTPNRSVYKSSRGGRVIRVVLKACIHPNALLPFLVVDSYGRVCCRALGEAFQKKVPVWWMEEDAVATCVDGATHTP
jgi:hypothetical protein